MKVIYGILIVLLVGVISGVAFAQDTVSSETSLLLQGQVTDTDGNPIEGAVVEIWQTDANGIYNHPEDSDVSELDVDFQYFGTAVSDIDGYYAFLTIKPGEYEPRPVHIHFKVKIEGETVLTSQFYFVEDFETDDGEALFGEGGDTLLLAIEDSEDEDGNLLRVATGNIILDLNGDDENVMQATARQQEGPFYPVVDFSDYDNNLTNSIVDEEPISYLFSMAFTLLNLNTATSDEFASISGMTNRMVREFEEYRPYISILQFRREIGKYVDDETVAGYEAYIYVPIDINASDVATLMQIPDLDETSAQTLIDARPFNDAEAFLAMVEAIAPNVDIDYASNFLATE